MFTWLKDHFIPHEGNDHRPRILHKHTIHRILGLVFFIEVFAFLIPTIMLMSQAAGTVLPTVLSNLTNQQREEQGLQPLTINSTLNEAAQEKANDMAENSYFAHVSPTGKTPWYWLDQVGYKYNYAGENLAVNFTDSQDVTTAWMNSPTHRANILKANYTEVGTGVAEGMYEGNETIFVAQDFASPSNTAPLATASPNIQVTKVATVSSHSEVLGAETSPRLKPAPVAVHAPVQGSSVVVAPAPVTPVMTEGPVPVAPVVIPTFWQRLLASPRTTTNVLLFTILGVVFLAVLLNLGAKLSHHHPDLMLNGAMAVAVIGCVFVMNNYLSTSNQTLIQSVDYSANHTVL